MRLHVNGASKVKRMLAGANRQAFQISFSSAVSALDAGEAEGHHHVASDEALLGKTSISGVCDGWRRRRSVIWRGAWVGFLY
jgi:hypothetical protein